MRNFWAETGELDFSVFNPNAEPRPDNVDLNRSYLAMVGLLEDVDTIIAAGEEADPDLVAAVSAKIRHCIGDTRLQNILDPQNTESAETTGNENVEQEEETQGTQSVQEVQGTQGTQEVQGTQGTQEVQGTQSTEGGEEPAEPETQGTQGAE